MMITAHRHTWTLAILVSLLLTALAAYAGDDIAWNVTLAPSADGRHSGRVLVTPAGHWHEGPGHTGQPTAVYHFHPFEPKTGALSPGIPASQDGHLLEAESDVSHPTPPGDDVEEALLATDWSTVVQTLTVGAEPLASPVAQFLLGHALTALNRPDEAFLLFWSAGSTAHRQAWTNWTDELVRRYPTHAVAHYLHGDARTRQFDWVGAVEAFNAALHRQPSLTLARHGRGAVYTVLEQWDEAILDFTQVTREAPTLAAGYLSLGTLWIARRAPEGAVEAFEQALRLVPTSFLAHNGLGCGKYGLGQWEQAHQAFVAAGEHASFWIVLRNLRAVAMAAEAIEAPGLETSPLFRPSDFLDWHALREATQAPDDLLRVLLGQPLPETMTPEILTALNAILEDPALYERHQHRFDLSAAPAALLTLLETTQTTRRQPTAALTAEEQTQIQRLNRLLIELAYPTLLAQHEARTPGMQLTAQGTLLKQSSTHVGVDIGPGKFRFDFNRQTNLSGSAALGGSMHKYMPTLPSLANAKPPNGVVIDIRRAYLDRGTWDIEAPFGLAYFAPVTTTSTE